MSSTPSTCALIAPSWITISILYINLYLNHVLNWRPNCLVSLHYVIWYDCTLGTRHGARPFDTLKQPWLGRRYCCPKSLCFIQVLSIITLSNNIASPFECIVRLKKPTLRKIRTRLLWKREQVFENIDSLLPHSAIFSVMTKVKDEAHHAISLARLIGAYLTVHYASYLWSMKKEEGV
jgi:hypothetical protein